MVLSLIHQTVHQETEFSLTLIIKSCIFFPSPTLLSYFTLSLGLLLSFFFLSLYIFFRYLSLSSQFPSESFFSLHSFTLIPPSLLPLLPFHLRSILFSFVLFLSSPPSLFLSSIIILTCPILPLLFLSHPLIL